LRRLAEVEPCPGPRKGENRACRYKLYHMAAALVSCVSEALGGQRRYAAHYLRIMHRKRAGFGALLPHSWRTADQSRKQSSYDPRKAQKKAIEQARTPERAKNAWVSKIQQKNGKKG
jgi:hypothetical protein